MAFEKQTTNNYRQPKADAFINVVITDAHGVEHRIRRGIPLEMSNLLERSIINKALNEPNYEITLTGSVHIVPDTSENAPDIEL